MINKKYFLYIALATTIGMTIPVNAAEKTFAQKAAAVAGKVGAGIVQLVNAHPYIFSLLPSLYITSKCFPINKATHPSEDFFILLPAAIGWIVSGKLLKTTTSIIMDNFDIKPVK